MKMFFNFLRLSASFDCENIINSRGVIKKICKNIKEGEGKEDTDLIFKTILNN
jgi:hypothetical protein